MVDFGLIKAEITLKIGLAISTKDIKLAEEVRDAVKELSDNPEVSGNPDFNGLMYDLRVTTEDAIVRLVAMDGTQVDDATEAVAKALNETLDPSTLPCLQFILDVDRNLLNPNKLKGIVEAFSMVLFSLQAPPSNLLFRQAIVTLANLSLIYLTQEDQLKILAKIQAFKQLV